MEKIVSFAARHCIVLVLFFAPMHWCAAQGTDISLLRSINVHRNKSFDAPMKAITNSVYPITVAAAGAELITGYATHDKAIIQNGWQTVFALGINTIVTYGLKVGVDRERPYVTYADIQPYKRESDPSFPSGHTSYAFATATSLSISYPKWYVIAPSFAYAAAVGYSRMHLGMHYPTDVAAGALVGAGSAWLSYEGMKWLQHKRTKKQPHAPEADSSNRP